MNWYIAKVAFNIVSGSGDHTPQFDEQYRLIKAESMEEAFQKAEYIGMNEEEVLLNEKHEIVKWDFVGISELYPVNELRDGMELFSGIHEVEDRGAYMELIKLKSAYVKSKFDTVSENV
ncbi:MAG TPA: DUF4288 domain-containing protein [Cyclobacteriaceae bacterium]|nr:DUF4288 domain-containing protein [Cyclobacteriaceae bacterium]HNP07574.1 DUF4288 domain-containing protein [Cyclobacteriaceae bacterium]HRK54115.1 DUF4288 domain-containing protein [Cyclobacteriaceae bacterium]